MTLFEALTGGAFDRLSWQHSGEFDENFSKKSNARGFARGGMGGFGIDRYIMAVRDIKVENIYTYLVIFSHFRSLSFFGSVQIISRLNSQSKFQMFTLIYWPPCWMTNEVLQHGDPILHTRLCNFVRHINFGRMHTPTPFDQRQGQKIFLFLVWFPVSLY